MGLNTGRAGSVSSFVWNTPDPLSVSDPHQSSENPSREQTHVVAAPEHNVPRVPVPIAHPQLRQRRPERHELGPERAVWRAKRRHVERPTEQMAQQVSATC